MGFLYAIVGITVLSAAFCWVMSGDLGLHPKVKWMWTWEITYGVLFTSKGFPIIVLHWEWGDPPPWRSRG